MSTKARCSECGGTGYVPWGLKYEQGGPVERCPVCGITMRRVERVLTTALLWSPFGALLVTLFRLSGDHRFRRRDVLLAWLRGCGTWLLLWQVWRVSR